jgi:hypothetical protein
MGIIALIVLGLGAGRWVTAQPAAAVIPAQMTPPASAASGACSGPGPPLRRPPPRPHKR